MIATHPAPTGKSRVGVTREGVVYERFFTNLPQDAFTARDIVALYLHRGAFENALADEDLEQDPDCRLNLSLAVSEREFGPYKYYRKRRSFVLWKKPCYASRRSLINS